MKCFIKVFDIFIIIIAAGITAFSINAAYRKSNGASSVLIRAEGVEWIYQINVNETVRINGHLGDTVVRIRDNHAWVESSPCENQNCVAAGFISRQGQWAACLPNNVLIMILGNGDEDIDAVVW